MKNIQRYSSHLMLQYLMKKYKVSERKLRHEMSEYYSDPAFSCTATKSGKINRVTVKPDHKQPVLFSEAPKPKPKVTLKPRRTIVR